MRRTFFYHEECLAEVENAARTSTSPVHELCARCGREGQCVEAEVSTADLHAIGEAKREREEAESIPAIVPEELTEKEEEDIRLMETAIDPDRWEAKEEEEIVAETVVQTTDYENMTLEELKARLQELEKR